MTLKELDNYFNSFLKKENYANDIAINGIQVENSDPDKKEIKKIAFAVDACEATEKIAAELGADLLFVHHGLFWGHCQPITESLYKRLSTLINKDMALCAYHIPLDANNPYGNNYGLASRLGLTNVEPFGSWKGMTIGVKGELPEPLTIDVISEKVMRIGKMPCAVLRFGKKEIKECKVDVIKADMRAVPYIQAKGDLVLTDKHKDALVQSVNFALAHPNEAPPQTARDPAILEPLE